jgi:hypothetical protein
MDFAVCVTKGLVGNLLAKKNLLTDLRESVCERGMVPIGQLVICLPHNRLLSGHLYATLTNVAGC